MKDKNPQPQHEPAFFSGTDGRTHILFKRTYKPRKNGKPQGDEFHTIKGAIENIIYVASARTVRLTYKEKEGWSANTLTFKNVSLADHNSFVSEYYAFVRGETFIEKL